MELSPEQIAKLEKVIGLPFVDEPSAEGNLCFAGNKEVRAEYKESFSSVDVRHYLAGLKCSQNNRDFDLTGTAVNFPYPPNASRFWSMVEIGSRLE